MPKKVERTMGKEKFSENPKINVTEKKPKLKKVKPKLKKVKLSAPSRSGAKQVRKKAAKGFPPS
jgi:hypothetical protein